MSSGLQPRPTRTRSRASIATPTTSSSSIPNSTSGPSNSNPSTDINPATSSTAESNKPTRNKSRSKSLGGALEGVGVNSKKSKDGGEKKDEDLTPRRLRRRSLVPSRSILKPAPPPDPTFSPNHPDVPRTISTHSAIIPPLITRAQSFGGLGAGATGEGLDDDDDDNDNEEGESDEVPQAQGFEKLNQNFTTDFSSLPRSQGQGGDDTTMGFGRRVSDETEAFDGEFEVGEGGDQTRAFGMGRGRKSVGTSHARRVSFATKAHVRLYEKDSSKYPNQSPSSSPSVGSDPPATPQTTAPSPSPSPSPTKPGGNVEATPTQRSSSSAGSDQSMSMELAQDEITKAFQNQNQQPFQAQGVENETFDASNSSFGGGGDGDGDETAMSMATSIMSRDEDDRGTVADSTDSSFGSAGGFGAKGADDITEGGADMSLVSAGGENEITSAFRGFIKERQEREQDDRGEDTEEREDRERQEEIDAIRGLRERRRSLRAFVDDGPAEGQDPTQTGGANESVDIGDTGRPGARFSRARTDFSSDDEDDEDGEADMSMATSLVSNNRRRSSGAFTSTTMASEDDGGTAEMSLDMGDSGPIGGIGGGRRSSVGGGRRLSSLGIRSELEDVNEDSIDIDGTLENTRNEEDDADFSGDTTRTTTSSGGSADYGDKTMDLTSHTEEYERTQAMEVDMEETNAVGDGIVYQSQSSPKSSPQSFEPPQPPQLPFLPQTPGGPSQPEPLRSSGSSFKPSRRSSIVPHYPAHQVSRVPSLSIIYGGATPSNSSGGYTTSSSNTGGLSSGGRRDITRPGMEETDTVGMDLETSPVMDQREPANEGDGEEDTADMSIANTSASFTGDLGNTGESFQQKKKRFSSPRRVVKIAGYEEGDSDKSWQEEIEEIRQGRVSFPKATISPPIEGSGAPSQTADSDPIQEQPIHLDPPSSLAARTSIPPVTASSPATSGRLDSLVVPSFPHRASSSSGSGSGSNSSFSINASPTPRPIEVPLPTPGLVLGSKQSPGFKFQVPRTSSPSKTAVPPTPRTPSGPDHESPKKQQPPTQGRKSLTSSSDLQNMVKKARESIGSIGGADLSSRHSLAGDGRGGLPSLSSPIRDRGNEQDPATGVEDPSLKLAAPSSTTRGTFGRSESMMTPSKRRRSESPDVVGKRGMSPSSLARRAPEVEERRRSGSPVTLGSPNRKRQSDGRPQNQSPSPIKGRGQGLKRGEDKGNQGQVEVGGKEWGKGKGKAREVDAGGDAVTRVMNLDLRNEVGNSSTDSDGSSVARRMDSPEPISPIDIEDFLAQTKLSFAREKSNLRRKSEWSGRQTGADDESLATSSTMAAMVVARAKQNFYQMYVAESDQLKLGLTENNELFDTLDREILSRPPVAIREWLRASEENKQTLGVQFRTIANFFREQVNEEWKKYRASNLMASLEAIQSDIAGVKEDGAFQQKINEELSTAASGLDEKHARLKAELAAERARDRELAHSDQEHLSGLRAGIAEQGEQLAEMSREKDELQAQDDKYRSKLEEINREKASILADIKRAKQVCESAQVATDGEALKMQEDLRLRELVSGWKIVEYDSKLNLVYQDEISAKFTMSPGSYVNNLELSLLGSQINGKRAAVTHFLFGRLKTHVESGKKQKVQALLREISFIWRRAIRLRDEIRWLCHLFPIDISLITKKSRTAPLLRVAVKFSSQKVRAQWAVLFESSGEEILSDVGVHKVVGDLGAETEVLFGNIDVEEVNYLIREGISRATRGALAKTCVEVERKFQGPSALLSDDLVKKVLLFPDDRPWEENV